MTGKQSLKRKPLKALVKCAANSNYNIKLFEGLFLCNWGGGFSGNKNIAENHIRSTTFFYLNFLVLESMFMLKNIVRYKI